MGRRIMPRLICLGNVVVDVVLEVPRLPARGGDVLATATRIAAGGALNVMAAAARQGMAVTYAGALGSGRFAQIAAQALAADGIEAPVPPKVGQDTGVVVCAVEPGGERTFLTGPGAEAALTGRDLAGVTAAPGDAVFLSGYGLAHRASRSALLAWLGALGAGPVVIVDPGPLAADIDPVAMRRALARADWLTCNEHEARVMTGGRDPMAAARALAAALGPGPGPGGRGGRGRRRGGGAVVRVGPGGCVLCRAGQDPVPVAGFPVRAQDTTGAGDTHTGVFAAALAEGADWMDAARRANAAAALSVTRAGPATAPSREELDAFLAAR